MTPSQPTPRPGWCQPRPPRRARQERRLLGREMAAPTPFNDAVIEVMNGIDDKTLEQSDAHVDRILKAVGQ